MSFIVRLFQCVFGSAMMYMSPEVFFPGLEMSIDAGMKRCMGGVECLGYTFYLSAGFCGMLLGITMFVIGFYLVVKVLSPKRLEKHPR